MDYVHEFLKQFPNNENIKKNNVKVLMCRLGQSVGKKIEILFNSFYLHRYLRGNKYMTVRKQIDRGTKKFIREKNARYIAAKTKIGFFLLNNNRKEL